jgi:hypothetical protein
MEEKEAEIQQLSAHEIRSRRCSKRVKVASDQAVRLCSPRRSLVQPTLA